VNPVAIASIHATILAIIIGISSAYSLHVAGMNRIIEIQAIAEAVKINTVRFSAIWYRGPYDLLDLNTIYPHLSEKIHDSAFLAKRLDDLLSRPHGIQVPEKPLERVRESLLLMSVLSHSSPFPDRFNISEIAFSPEAQIAFTNLDEVMGWANDFLRTFRALILHYKMLGFPKFDEDLDEWEKSEEYDKYSTLPQITAMAKLKHSKNARLLTEEFFDNLTIGYEIAKSVKLYEPPFLSYQKGIKSKKWLFPILLLGGLTFLSGVILPLVKSSVSRIYLLWVPIGFYTTIFGCILYFLFLA
jgi:hypothetical protein